MSSEILQLLFTAIVSIATCAYAILTIILVKETIRLREAQTEPEIIIYLQPSENLPSIFDIVVKNIGGGTAYNIKWEFDKNAILAKERGSSLDQQNFFTKGASYFAPGQIYHSVVGTGIELLKEPAPPPLLMQANFENRQQKKYHREYLIDPIQYRGRYWIDPHGLRQIENTLKDIEKNFGHVFSGFGRLNINTYDSDDRDQENKVIQKRLAEQQKPQRKKKSQ
jgi:hypothetical protein